LLKNENDDKQSLAMFREENDQVQEYINKNKVKLKSQLTKDDGNKKRQRLNSNTD